MYVIPGVMSVNWNPTNGEKVMAEFFSSRGVTNNTQRDAAIDAATLAQLKDFVREICKCFVVGPPL